MDVDTALKKRTAGKTQFTRAENRVRDALQEDEVDEWIIEKRYSDFKERFDKIQDLNEDYVSFLTEEADLQAADQWIDDLVKRFDSVEILVSKQLRKVKPQPPIVKAENPITTSKPSHSLIKVKKLELEIFSGDIRRYPQFKSD